MNGIILNGRIFKAVPKGTRHCHDCDLYDYCEANPRDMGEICIALNHLLSNRIYFEKSQELTDKLNRE